RRVRAASAATCVNVSSVVSQNRVGPPCPRNFAITSAKPKPNASVRSTTLQLSAKEGSYCGDVADGIQPLLPVGRNTPRRTGSDRPDRAAVDGHDAARDV